MNTIDWSTAPEGATHFLPEQPARGWVACFYKNIDGMWYSRNTRDSDWHPDNDYVEVFEPLLIKRPKKWSGSQDGLPPVGTMCELRLKSGDWIMAQIAYITETGCLWVPWGAQSETFNATYNMEFRPIRTPEQLAAEERENFIDECENFASVTNKIRDVFGMMYDAGYRQQVTK